MTEAPMMILTMVTSVSLVAMPMVGERRRPLPATCCWGPLAVLGRLTLGFGVLDMLFPVEDGFKRAR